MKVALGQIRIISNNPNKNYLEMEDTIKRAIKENADIIIFPELCVSGAYVSKRNLNDNFIEDVLSYNDKIVALSKDIDIIWGSYYKEELLYNAAYYAKNGAVVDYSLKSNLDKSRNEDQFFTPKSKSFSIEIEDIMYEVSLDNHKENTIYLCTNIYKHDESIPMKKNSILISGVGIYNDGNSVFGLRGESYFNYHGLEASLNEVYESELLVLDTQSFIEYLNIPSDEILPYILPIIEMFDEEHLSYGPKWIVGVSGGLDSSVSLALLSLAIGEDRVHGVTMPGEFTRDITLSNAYHLSKKLGVSFQEIPIGKLVKETVNTLNEAAYDRVEGLTYENIQARLRGHTLMSVASLINGVVCNNGNKVETGLGYATMYGDAIGALSVLGDLTKLEVGQLAREINEAYDEDVIPLNLIPKIESDRIAWDFAPSAELSQDQFDPFKWGYHDNLLVYLLSNSPESVLEMYLDESIYNTNFGMYMKHLELDNPHAFIEDFEWFLRTIQLATYKRLQTPPIVRVSKVGFEFENQSNIYKTKQYELLKEEILKK